MIRSRLCALLLLLSFGPIANATVIIPVELDELSRSAVTIVRGSVVSTEGRWVEDRGDIETLVTLQAETYLKGPLGTTVQFRVPGGQVGRHQRVVIGAPRFDVGQRVVVFLGTNGPSIPHVLGLSQGVYRIDRGMVMAPAILPGVRAARPVRSNATRQPMALRDFEARVRTLSRSVR